MSLRNLNLNKFPIHEIISLNLNTIQFSVLIVGLIDFLLLHIFLDRKKVSIYLFKFQSLFYQYISKKNKDSQSPTKKVLEEQSVCRGDVEMVFRSLGILGNGDHQDEKFQERLGVSDIFNIFEDQNPNLDEVKEAFEVFDENRDGFFDAGDLQRVLCGLGLKEGLEMENCRKMICVFDENGDGRMDFDEFLKFMENSFI